MFVFQIFVHEKTATLQGRLDALQKGYKDGSDWYPNIQELLYKRNNAASSKGAIMKEYVGLLDAAIDIRLCYLEECRDAVKKGSKDLKAIDAKYETRLFENDPKIEKIEGQLSAPGFRAGTAKQETAPIMMTALTLAAGVKAPAGNVKQVAATPQATTSLSQTLTLYPVSVDDVWKDTKEAYERNNKGLDDVPELKLSAANTQFVRIIDYALANNWINGEQKGRLMKGELPESFGKELALLKAMLRVSTQRGGMKYVTDSFDAHKGKTLDQVLSALPEIAGEMAWKGKKVGASSVKFWAREFDAILKKQGVDKSALVTEPVVEEVVIERPAEVPGTLDKYEDLEVFKQDWRTAIYRDAWPGGLALESEYGDAGCKTEEGWSPDALGEKTKTSLEFAAVKEPEPGVKKASEAAVSFLTADEKSLKAIMVAAGALAEGNSRKDLRDAGLGGGIVQSGGKYYALSGALAQLPSRREIAKNMAEGNVADPQVAGILRDMAAASLMTLGIVDLQYKLVRGSNEAKRAFEGYARGTAPLTPELQAFLAGEAKARAEGVLLDRTTIGALMAMEPSVKLAFEEKCGGADKKINMKEENDAAVALYNSIKGRQGLKDENGNFVKERVVAAIRGEEKREEPVQQATEEEVVQLPAAPQSQVASTFASIDAALADKGIAAELAKIEASKRELIARMLKDQFKAGEVNREDVVKAIGEYASLP